MKCYVGTDIVEIERVRRAVARLGERFLARVYTEAEIKAYAGSPSSLAVRFAGKEAVMKLLGTPGKGVPLRDIETLSGPGGRPRLNLYGRARQEADRLGIEEIAISFSHSRRYAMATAVAISERDA